MQLSGAVVLLTGSSQGIGQACAAALNDRGARVILHGRNADVLDDVAAGLGAKVLAADLREPDAVPQLARDAWDVYGAIDAVVHSAGVGWHGQCGTMDPAKIDELLDVNLRAPLHLTRLLLPKMVVRGRGHLAFIASIAGLTGVARESVYAATKSALITFADSLRLELAGTGLAVSVVSPGAVRTGFFDHRGAPYRRHVPRPVGPERVAAAVVRRLERGDGDVVLPHWLALAPKTRAMAPRLYRVLNRHFG